MTDSTRAEMAPIELEIEAAERSIDFSSYPTHPRRVKCPVHNIVERQIPGPATGELSLPGLTQEKFWRTPWWN